MAVKWGRDRLGRLYWYDAESGKRTKRPADAQRPRAFRRDKRGRGYWTFLDTGQRAPKPLWNEAPRWDRLGRPLDSTGRRIPRDSLQAEPVLGPPPKRRPTKAKTPVRPKMPARVRYQLRRADEQIPGFPTGRGVYVTKPTYSPPRDLERIFGKWLQGALRKSPLASASEIGFRQHGIAFTVRAPLDMRALAELTSQLEGQPIRIVYRTVGHNEWEIWMHLNRPERRTQEVGQKGYRAVGEAFKAGQRAANIIYDYLEGWDADFSWYEYFETDDEVYEG